MKLRILVWFILGITALSIDAVAGAQTVAPAPQAVLGVMLRELTAEDAQAPATKGVQGAFVQTVVPNGPAERAGVRAKDIIVGANRQAVASAVQLVQMIGSRNPGDVIELVVLRAVGDKQSASRLRRHPVFRRKPRRGRLRSKPRLNPVAAPLPHKVPLRPA